MDTKAARRGGLYIGWQLCSLTSFSKEALVFDSNSLLGKITTCHGPLEQAANSQSGSSKCQRSACEGLMSMTGVHEMEYKALLCLREQSKKYLNSK